MNQFADLGAYFEIKDGVIEKKQLQVGGGGNFNLGRLIIDDGALASLGVGLDVNYVADMSKAERDVAGATKSEPVHTTNHGVEAAITAGIQF